MASNQNDTNSENEPKDITINVHDAIHTIESDTVEIWVSYSFAPDWFNDAVQEAKGERGNYNARRREILFAVAFAESYLVEWVRDEVLNRDFQRFSHYFPPGRMSDPVSKWKDIPKQLLEDRLITAVPDFGKKYWEEWTDLIKYRNGLVHAGASRPERATLSDMEKPLPPLNLLAQLEPGWAVKVVVQLVTQLHETVGSSMPNWLQQQIQEMKRP
jgi:hypothetical protein